MSQYHATIRHMKRNLSKRPRIHRGLYLKIDIRKHHPRECNTLSRIRTHTPNQHNYVSLPLHQPERTTTGNSMLRKQHASEAYCFRPEKRIMLKDRHTIPVTVNCHTKIKGSFKACVGCTTSLASCSVSCFCRINFVIKRKGTTDVSHTGGVAVEKFKISRSQRVESQYFERKFCYRVECSM